MTAAERKALKEAVSAATRAALPPNARPGHPSRFGWLREAGATGREIRLPSLQDYDRMPIYRPNILRALNG